MGFSDVFVLADKHSQFVFFVSKEQIGRCLVLDLERSMDLHLRVAVYDSTVFVNSSHFRKHNLRVLLFKAYPIKGVRAGIIYLVQLIMEVKLLEVFCGK